MNQFFNLTRFGRLLRKHSAEYATSYALGAAVLLGGMLVVMGFIAYVGGGLSRAGQGVLFILFLLGAGSFFTSTVLGQFGVGSRAALALTLPASPFEKYLLAWVFSLPVFLVVFVADFYLADWLIVSLSPSSTLLNIFVRSDATATVLVVYLLVHGVALFGSIAFRQQQFIKTAFLFFAVALLLGVGNYQILRLLVASDIRVTLPFGSVNMLSGPSLGLPEALEQQLVLPLLALIPLLWLAAYARLTEKQL
ncbi:MAG: hypothetical protein EOO36_03485 [Cytophagaceae bacterium]|nr:MAG: hypothetical protein EOO36_03485 [Cytophagaceae bacterium]